MPRDLLCATSSPWSQPDTWKPWWSRSLTHMSIFNFWCKSHEIHTLSFTLPKLMVPSSTSLHLSCMRPRAMTMEPTLGRIMILCFEGLHITWVHFLDTRYCEISFLQINSQIFYASDDHDFFQNSRKSQSCIGFLPFFLGTDSYVASSCDYGPNSWAHSDFTFWELVPCSMLKPSTREITISLISFHVPFWFGRPGSIFFWLLPKLLKVRSATTCPPKIRNSNLVFIVLGFRVSGSWSITNLPSHDSRFYAFLWSTVHGFPQSNNWDQLVSPADSTLWIFHSTSQRNVDLLPCTLPNTNE